MSLTTAERIERSYREVASLASAYDHGPQAKELARSMATSGCHDIDVALVRRFVHRAVSVARRARRLHSALTLGGRRVTA